MSSMLYIELSLVGHLNRLQFWLTTKSANIIQCWSDIISGLIQKDSVHIILSALLFSRTDISLGYIPTAYYVSTRMSTDSRISVAVLLLGQYNCERVPV